MPALHATWGPDRHLHLWGEDPEAYERLSARRAGSRPGHRLPPAHPFALGPQSLRDALAAQVGDAGAGIARLEVLLPSRGGAPLPSPALAVTPRAARGRAEPAPWRVTSLALDGPAALRALAGLGGDEPDRGGGLPGLGEASVRFYSRLARVALEIVARGRVLPGIREAGRGRFAARWEPVPGAADAARLRALARAMPPVCRCAALDGAERPANDVAAEALGVLVDASVRAAAARAQGDETGPTAGSHAAHAVAMAWSGSDGGDAGAALSGALLGRDAALPPGDPAAMRRLARALAGWRAASLPDEGPLRTVFRLAEPRPDEMADVPAPGPDAPWTIEILVGPRDEPSLLVPARDVWVRPSLLGAAPRDVPADEALLADLGRASRLYPPLDAALSSPRPDSLGLDAKGAHAFLREGAPLLADAGFGVLVPSWWRNRRRRLGLRVRARGRPGQPKTSVGRGVDARAIVEYEISAVLGDATLSEAELREIARLMTPLVQVRGEWVEVPPDEISAALAAMSSGAGSGVRTATVAEFLRDVLAPRADLPVVEVDASGWVERLLPAGDGVRNAVGEGAADQDMATPPGFHGELRGYQRRGLAWLAFLDRLGLGACLADDMGLGKTAQVLALLVAERAAAGEPAPEGAAGAPTRSDAISGRGDGGGEGADDGDADQMPAPGGPTLVVCPMSVVGNWQREAERFAPSLRVHVHHGAERLAGDELATATRDADLVITTYATAARDAPDLERVEWRRVVLDEAQAIKNSDTRQSRAVRRLPSAGRVALTGTPVENRLTELWSILDFLNPGLLGSEAAFRDRYAIPIEQDADDEAAERLRRLTGPFILRRVKQDPAIGLELPAKLEMTVSCNLTREQASLYQATVDDMLEQIEGAEGIRRKGLVLETIGRLKQVCNHPAQALGDGSLLAGRSGKLAQLEDILEDALPTGDRVLVFTQYASFGEMLRPYLRDRFGREVLFLHGGTPRGMRDRLVERFQAGLAPVFILSLKAGGSGINLTAANQVVHFDRWWNPAVEDQASDRAYRIGQTRQVQVRKLVCTGTIEERIAEMSEAKRELAARIVGTGERWLTELSTTELRELLALSADAVAEG